MRSGYDRRYDRDPDDERELDMERREWARERLPSAPTSPATRAAVRRAAAKAYPAAFAPDPEWRGDKVDL